MDQKEIDPQLEGLIGYLGQYDQVVNPQELGIAENEEVWVRDIAVMARPESLISEKIFFKNKTTGELEVTKIVYWFNMKMGGTVISTIAFDDAGVPLEVTSRIIEETMDKIPDYVNSPMSHFGNNADAAGEYRTLAEVKELVSDARLVYFTGSVSSPSLVKTLSATFNNLGASPKIPFEVGDGKKINKMTRMWLEKYPNNNQYEFVTDMFEYQTTDVDQVIVEHDLMALFTENK